jgi:hypothetical protein
MIPALPAALTSYSARILPPNATTEVLAMPLTVKSKGLKKKPPDGLPTLNAPRNSICRSRAAPRINHSVTCSSRAIMRCSACLISHACSIYK